MFRECIIPVSYTHLEYDSEHNYINDIDIDSPGISGFGFGIDLGASYKILNNLTVSAAILDLGFINWSKSNTTIATTNSQQDVYKRQLLANRPDVKAAEMALASTFYNTNQALSLIHIWLYMKTNIVCRSIAHNTSLR